MAKLQEILTTRKACIALCFLALVMMLFMYLANRVVFSIRRVNTARYTTNTQQIHNKYSSDIKAVLDAIVPPSTGRRKLSARYAKLTPQAAAMLKHWTQGKNGGVFVEVGAYDGETSSNTLALEVYYNWTGLLIEADSDYFTQLVAKRRHAYSLKACISGSSHTELLHFNEAGGQIGAVVFPQTSEQLDPDVHLMPCLSLSEVLLTLNYSHINYLSLDVEGLEYDILETFPHDKIQIDYISAEYLHVRQGQAALVQMMLSHGYRLLEKLYSIDECRETFVHDLLFVKKRI